MLVFLFCLSGGGYCGPTVMIVVFVAARVFGGVCIECLVPFIVCYRSPARGWLGVMHESALGCIVSLCKSLGARAALFSYLHREGRGFCFTPNSC